MPSQTTDTTSDGAPQLAAIEQRYERAKARIAGADVPADSDHRVHDTIAVDVEITKPPLVAVRRSTDGDREPGAHRTEHDAAPAADAPQRGRRLWRSLRMPRLVGRSLTAS